VSLKPTAETQEQETDEDEEPRLWLGCDYRRLAKINACRRDAHTHAVINRDVRLGPHNRAIEVITVLDAKGLLQRDSFQHRVDRQLQ
jgi:hypothetical protein